MTTHCELTHVLAFKIIFLTQLVTINMASVPAQYDPVKLKKLLTHPIRVKSLSPEEALRLVEFLDQKVSRLVRIRAFHLIARTGFRGTKALL